MQNEPILSLCPNCYCMTRTIDGKCGKCNESKSHVGDINVPNNGQPGQELHIREWKYWSDEILDQVQSYYEFNCGYNGECDHVWVPVKDDKYKLPAIENKFKYVLVVAATRKKAIATTLDEQRREHENELADMHGLLADERKKMLVELKAWLVETYKLITPESYEETGLCLDTLTNVEDKLIELQVKLAQMGEEK